MLKPIACLCSCLLIVSGASAQEPEAESRAELLEKIREQKARALRPYEPSRVEKALLYVEKHRLVERLTIIDGWYPRIGGMTTGGGFAGGAGYRKHFFGNELFLNTSAAISMKGYKEFIGEASYPSLEGGLFEFGGMFRWRDFPQEDFFGIGPNSSVDTRTNYALKSTDVSAHGTLKPLRWLRGGVEIGWLSPRVGHGTDPRMPSIEQVFTDAQAPGLTDQPTYLYKNVFVKIDYRDQVGNPRSGGLWQATYGSWDDRDLNQFDFNRFDAEAAHFFPIFDKKRVFALRGRVVYVNNDPGHRVPFYFFPYIGGSDTVRGFREFRFRDENIVFVNAEYRWEAFAGLDMALFYDIGEVSSNWEDIDLRDAKTSYGVGFRFNNFRSVFLRLDIGTGGGEGTRIFFKFGPAF